MTTIYIVMGDAGEYDDRREWLVIAYADEAMAREHAAKADAESLRISRTLDGLDPVNNWQTYAQARNALIASNAFDPGMQDNYPRATYSVCSLELATALPVEVRL